MCQCVCACQCVSQTFSGCPCAAQPLRFNSLLAWTNRSSLIPQSESGWGGMFFSLTLSWRPMHCQRQKALECWQWPSPALAFYSAGPRWNWPDIMPQPLSFKHLPKGRGCQIHHNITLLRIHSQRSEAFWSKLFPLFSWFIWELCGAEREKPEVRKNQM